MKFCKNCGNQLVDEAVVCPNCGVAADNGNPYGGPNPYAAPAKDNSGLALAAKIFLVIGCICQGLFILPLAWCLPLTISFWRKVDRGEPVSVGLKVCLLLFVNTIGGILALCMGENY